MGMDINDHGFPFDLMCLHANAVLKFAISPEPICSNIIILPENLPEMKDFEPAID